LYCGAGWAVFAIAADYAELMYFTLVFLSGMSAAILAEGGGV